MVEGPRILVQGICFYRDCGQKMMYGGSLLKII